MSHVPGSAARQERIELPTVAPGTRRELTVFRYGTPGARPKAYLQAGLHADELPGMLVLRHLLEALDHAAARDAIKGEIVVLPVANPIGLSQFLNTYHLGRYDFVSGDNFNRGYCDLVEPVARRVAGRLGADPGANVAMIRAAMAVALAEQAPVGEFDLLRHTLLRLAHDADIVLDLHADTDALVHLYVGTPLWPGATDLAADIDARVVLTAEDSGGNAFDEACSAPWWQLRKRFPDHPIPPACLASTLELRDCNAVDDRLARDDAAGLLRFLTRRGLLDGDAGAPPRLLCDATPLDGMDPVKAPVAGLVVYRRQLGDRVRAGETIAEIVDPLGASLEVAARTDGLLFARSMQRFVRPGTNIAKIAGAETLPDRVGHLLSD
jgi:predicted deacylase